MTKGRADDERVVDDAEVAAVTCRVRLPNPHHIIVSTRVVSDVRVLNNWVPLNGKRSVPPISGSPSGCLLVTVAGGDANIAKHAPECRYCVEVPAE